MRKRIGGLILAAGCSKRMGDFKPLMPLRGKTLIENTIDSMLLCGISPITVVLGHRGRDIEAILKSRYLGTGLTMVYNNGYYSVGSSSANRPMPSDPYLWKDSTIDAILSNRKYTGCMVNLKTTTVSYKVHKLIRKPEEECRAGTNRLSGGQRSCRFRHLSRIILSANDWKATIRGKRSEYPIC